MCAPTRGNAALAAMIVSCALSAAGAAPPAASFKLDPSTLDPSTLDETARLKETRAGHVSLTWTAGEGDWVYELQSAPGAAFHDPLPRYTGADEVSFISGLEDGEHFFRVRARAASSDAWGPWSDPVVVPVRHHSLTVAWWFFGAGFVLVGLTVAFILSNTRSSEHTDSNQPDSSQPDPEHPEVGQPEVNRG